MFAVGDKVKVIANADKRLKSYVGKNGKVTGAVTEHSCRVKIFYGDEVWFDNRELELNDSAVDENEREE